MPFSPLLSLVLFVTGAAFAVWSAEQLLKGLVTLSVVLRVSAFAIGAVLSGLEAENVAVGLVAGSQGAAAVALGTSFGGAMFLICIALGVGAVLYPLEVSLPREFLAMFVTAPVIAGLAIAFPVTPQWSGAVLLGVFFAEMAYLVIVSRNRNFIAISPEVEEFEERKPRVWVGVGLTILGIVAITVAGWLVAQGAIGVIAGFGVSAAVIGAVVTPAAIEAEEIARQAVPSHRGRHDVAAANAIGTLLYFLLFNLGLIVLVTPVSVPSSVRWVDWPFLIAATALATVFLWRGRVGRLAGASLIAIYAAFVLVHLALI